MDPYRRRAFHLRQPDHTGAVAQWRGIRGSSISATETDYERACNEAGYLGRIACGAAQVLVLGDEPAQATFIVTPNGPAIVRWIACESMVLANTVLAKVPDELSHLQSPLRFSVAHPALLMIDASASEAAETESSLSIYVEPAVFDITTERFQDGRSFDFWLHRFVRISS